MGKHVVIEKHNPNKTKGAWIKTKLLKINPSPQVVIVGRHIVIEKHDPNKTKGAWIRKKPPTSRVREPPTRRRGAG